MADDTDILATQDDVLDPLPASDQPAEKTMDDTIRETLEKIQSRGEAAGDELADEGQQAAERARDDKGRFAKPDAAQAQTPTASPPSGEAQPEPAAAPVTVPPELQRLGLRKEEAEAFSKADPVLRDAFIRRSEEMHRGFEQFRSKAELGNAFEQAMAPFAATLQSVGIHPAQAFQRLLVADHSLRHGTPEQKTQMLLKIAGDYGIDLNAAQQYQAEQPQADPQVQGLQQQLQQLQAWVLQRNHQDQVRQQASLNSEIAAFRADPANKHFEAVKADMAGLLQSGVAMTLKDAYDRAIYANPAVRAMVLAEQQAAADAARKADAERRAQEARRAAAVNVPRKGTLPAKKPVGTMEDTIRAEAERLGLM